MNAAEGGRQGRERDEGRGRLFSNAEILIRLLCKNPIFRTLGKILFSDCAKCRILLRANSGEEKLRRFFSFLVEKSGAGCGKGLAERERNIRGVFSPFRCQKAADNAFLHIAVKNHVILPLFPLIGAFTAMRDVFPSSCAFCGRRRARRVFCGLFSPILIASPVNAISGRDAPSFLLFDRHCPSSLLSALEIAPAHVYNVFMKSH